MPLPVLPTMLNGIPLSQRSAFLLSVPPALLMQLRSPERLPLETPITIAIAKAPAADDLLPLNDGPTRARTVSLSGLRFMGYEVGFRTSLPHDVVRVKSPQGVTFDFKIATPREETIYE